MTTLTHASHRLAALPAAIVRGFVRHSRERAAQAALESMSDASLRDIGLRRGDIRRAVHFGFPERH
jgi:uncharacterized protein YjiS (DUF1127 family)